MSATQPKNPMFKAVYSHEEEKGMKRDVIQQSLMHLAEEKKKIRALMETAELAQEKFEQDMYDARPLSASVLALMRLLEKSSGKGEWKSHLVAETPTKGEMPEIPDEVEARLNQMEGMWIWYKAGPWKYEAWHEGKCEDCRNPCRQVTSISYEGEDPITLKFQDRQGTTHRLEIDTDTLSDPDSTDADWECIDCDQSVGTAYHYLLLAIYRA